MINVNNFSTGSKLKIYMADGNPYSISTGLSQYMEKDPVNCDQAGIIGT